MLLRRHSITDSFILQRRRFLFYSFVLPSSASSRIKKLEFFSQLEERNRSYGLLCSPVALRRNMSSFNTSRDCFYLPENQTRSEVTGDMFREMKAYSPALLDSYCFINIVLAFLSFFGNALVVLTTVVFPELHIVANVGLASLATCSLLHGSILHSFLFAVAVNVLVDGCPIFRSTRFAIPSSLMCSSIASY